MTKEIEIYKIRIRSLLLMLCIFIAALSTTTIFAVAMGVEGNIIINPVIITTTFGGIITFIALLIAIGLGVSPSPSDAGEGNTKNSKRSE